jgi:hypothetical protein
MTLEEVTENLEHAIGVVQQDIRAGDERRQFALVQLLEAVSVATLELCRREMVRRK